MFHDQEFWKQSGNLLTPALLSPGLLSPLSAHRECLYGDEAPRRGTFRTPLTRYYIDTREYAERAQAAGTAKAKREPLPLIETLPSDIEHRIRQYRRESDRFMALASALLKFYFIHQTARIPWSEIEISRTPKPHSRPYWAAPPEFMYLKCKGLEFNCSHQAGMTILIGCETLNAPEHESEVIELGSPRPLPTPRRNPMEINGPRGQPIRLGIDVSCCNEPGRAPDLSNKQAFDDWVDVVGDMFSLREQDDMKNLAVKLPPIPGITEHEERARRFYTYWALKEAYIKMVGEGLLAEWLRELEFIDVTPPARAQKGSGDRFTKLQPTSDPKMKVLLRGRDITRTVHIDIEAYEEDFVIATVMRGVRDANREIKWEKIDLDGQIRECARGVCTCLEDDYD